MKQCDRGFRIAGRYAGALIQEASQEWYYVLCTRDRAIPPPLQRRMIAENTCADVIELDTDHTPQLSMTNKLAKALHRFATHSSAGAGRLAERHETARRTTRIQ